MLNIPLIHPPLLGALAATGHGSRVLIADANYAHATNVRPGAPVIYLNLRRGLVRVDQVLELIVQTAPLEEVHAMRPDEGGEPDVFADYRAMLGPRLPLRILPRLDFYTASRAADVAFAVATGDERLYANVLLTIGYTAPA